MLEATFFGVVLLGRDRVPPWFYFLAVLHGLARHHGCPRSGSWATTAGCRCRSATPIVDGKFVPDDWWAIITGPVLRVRWPHMLLAAFLTTGMSVIATGAWYLLRGTLSRRKARVMLHWGLWLVAVLIPVQLFFGHLTGDYVHALSAGEVRGDRGALARPSSPATEVLIAHSRRGRRSATCSRIEVPRLGSFIASGTWDSREVGLDDFPAGGPAAGGHPVLDFPRDGRHGPHDAGDLLVRQLAALARPPGDHALVPVGGVPVVPHRLRRRADRLVHGRGRPPALGRLRPVAHQGCGDAVADDRATCCSRSSAISWSTRSSIRSACYYIYRLLRDGPAAEDQRRRHRPTALAERPATHRGTQAMTAIEPSSLALFWAGVIAVGDPGLRHPRRLRSRRRHPVRHHRDCGLRRNR